MFKRFRTGLTTRSFLILLFSISLECRQTGGGRVGIAIAPSRPDLLSDIVLRAEQPGGIGSLVFSPNGDLLVSGTKGAVKESVKLWALATPDVFRPLTGTEDYAISLAFSPDGRFVSAGGRSVRIFNAQDGLIASEVKSSIGTITSMDFSPDGTWLALAGDVVEIWDWRKPSKILTLNPKGQVLRIRFSPDGALLAVAIMSSLSGAVEIHNTASGALLQTITLAAGRPYAIAFSPDRRMLAVGTRTATIVDPPSGRMRPLAENSATISVWNVADGRLQRSMAAGDWVSAVTFSPTGNSVIATSGKFQQTGSALALNLRSGELSTLIPAVSAEETAAFSPDRKWLAASDGNQTLRLWKLPQSDER
jgi:WD40 repeat protein